MVQPKRYTRQEILQNCRKNAADLSRLRRGLPISAMAKLMQEAITEGRGFQRIFTGGFAQTPAADLNIKKRCVRFIFRLIIRN